MGETEGVIALLVAVLGTGGGARWLFGWLDRRQAKQHAHDNAMAARFAAMQQAFLDRDLEHSAELRTERAERFADVRTFTATITDMGNKLADALERIDSRRPPRE